MNTYDIRDAANRGDFDWCTNVSTTYNLAMMEIGFDGAVFEDLGIPQDVWDQLRADNPESFGVETDDGEDYFFMFDAVKISVKIKMGECDTCYGRGSYVNPAIDSHGIGSDEWDRDWSYEDRDRYMSGFYDQRCNACGGSGRYPFFDWDKNPKWLCDYKEQSDKDAYYEAQERAAELRYGY